MTVQVPDRTVVKQAEDFWGTLSEEYDVDSVCDSARKKNDPLLAPHGFFRKLAHGNNHQALEFLEKFGPLERNDWRILMPGDSRTGPDYLRIEDVDNFHLELQSKGMRRKGMRRLERIVHVRLADFWDKHLTFQIISRLYEGRDNLGQLEVAWKDLERHWGRTGLLARFISPEALPANWRTLPAPSPITVFWSQSDTAKKESALSMAYFGVSHFLRDLSPRWRLVGEGLYLVPGTMSLWQMIWNLFANDTAQGPWRICPLCARIFYPKRRDQDCCSTRHQTLWSKREYARRIRAARKSKSRSSKPRRR